MNNNNSAIQQQATSAIESVLIEGDLSKLSQADRELYYAKVCQSLGLNPLTKPFGYIRFDGKLTLYAKKDCTEQLRNIRGISITKADLKIDNEMAIVEVIAIDKTGRSDCDIGCLSIKGLSGDRLGNALMKCVTKAKRRVTLSICGLGFMDETEAETIPDAQFVDRPSYPTIDSPSPTKQLPPTQTEQHLQLAARIKSLKLSKEHLDLILKANSLPSVLKNLTPEEITKLGFHLNRFQETSEMMQELNMSPQEGQKILLENFGKEKRFFLTFKELLEFRDILYGLLHGDD